MTSLHSTIDPLIIQRNKGPGAIIRLLSLCVCVTHKQSLCPAAGPMQVSQWGMCESCGVCLLPTLQSHWASHPTLLPLIQRASLFPLSIDHLVLCLLTQSLSLSHTHLKAAGIRAPEERLICAQSHDHKQTWKRVCTTRFCMSQHICTCKWTFTVNLSYAIGCNSYAEKLQMFLRWIDRKIDGWIDRFFLLATVYYFYIQIDIYCKPLKHNRLQCIKNNDLDLIQIKILYICLYEIKNHSSLF